MKLVIVESPTKCHTIQRYLGDEYHVEASLGHVRDLATSGKGGLGVDVENDFAPVYIINKDKRKKVEELRELAKQADEVIIATDPDREGEAIGWHLTQVLGLDINTTKRLEFHEITRDSINAAIKNPRTIDMDIVHSQETRRILDRIIGFELSNLINKRIKSKSAGRVQSATLKLIAEKEEEIAKFEPEEYWVLNVSTKVGKKEYSLKIVDENGKELPIKNGETAQTILDKIGDTFTITSINKKMVTIEPKEPFRTSTLQQEAFTRLKFKTNKTMRIAQKLYEGVNIGGEQVGLITYMRTDNTGLSSTFINRAKAFITETYGSKYVAYTGKPHSSKDIFNAQDAHEPIRPTSNHRTPESVRKYLSNEEYQLYKLIYNRAVGSLMKGKTEEVMQIVLENNGLHFSFEFSRVVFDGFEVLEDKKKGLEVFPNLYEGDSLPLVNKSGEQKWTQPPAHYNEAKIVSVMEDVGIGRPSTYAQTIDTLYKRKYTVSESNSILITPQGTKTNIVLNKYFPIVMNIKYTATMEDDLDKISEGVSNRSEVLSKYYKEFEEELEDATTKMYSDPEIPTGEMCPDCGSPLVYKEGKNGSFIGCSNWPKCKYTRGEDSEPAKPTGEYCPNCGKELVERKNSKGETFVGCSGYPKCDYIKHTEKKETKTTKPQIVKKCPICGGNLIKKKGKHGYFLGCDNFPKCTHMEPIKKYSKHPSNNKNQTH